MCRQESGEIGRLTAVTPAAIFARVDELRPHEALEKDRLDQLRHCLLEEGVLHRPVIVDGASGVILDGHHRVQALRDLGCTRVPAFLVAYDDPSIQVYSRRPGLVVDKATVIQRGLIGDPFPPRTSRHVFGSPMTGNSTHIDALRVRAIRLDGRGERWDIPAR